MRKNELEEVLWQRNKLLEKRKLLMKFYDIDIKAYTGMTYDEPRSGVTYKINRPVERAAINIEEQLFKIKAEITNIDTTLFGIELAMIELDENEKKVIERRYFDKKTFKQIAVEMGFSRSQVYRIKDEALDTMTEALNRIGRKWTKTRQT